MVIRYHQFIDFCTIAGLNRLDVVRKATDERAVANDFYAPLVAAIKAYHEDGRGLKMFATSHGDSRKRGVYPQLAKSYVGVFAAMGPVKWSTPPSLVLKLGDLTIDATPEFGYAIAGSPYLVGAYFNGEPLAQRRRVLTLSLLAMAAIRAGRQDVIGLMDVSHGKLHTMRVSPSPRVGVLLRAEAAAFSSIMTATIGARACLSRARSPRGQRRTRIPRTAC